MIATNFRYSVARVTIVTPPRTIKEEEEDESGTIVPSSRSGRHKYVSCLQSITPGNDSVPSEGDLINHSESGNIEYIQYCLNNMIYINCIDVEDGRTPLHAACLSVHPSVVSGQSQEENHVSRTSSSCISLSVPAR